MHGTRSIQSPHHQTPNVHDDRLINSTLVCPLNHPRLLIPHRAQSSHPLFHRTRVVVAVSDENIVIILFILNVRIIPTESFFYFQTAIRTTSVQLDQRVNQVRGARTAWMARQVSRVLKDPVQWMCNHKCEALVLVFMTYYSYVGHQLHRASTVQMVQWVHQVHKDVQVENSF